jgi:predicted  nucleic acid-binding Zn-ribbon protein
MFKIIKWSLIGVVTLGAVGYFMLGDQFGSYIATAGTSVRDTFKKKIPVEFEIKRAEKLILAIGPEVKACKLEVARAVVELEYLQRAVTRLEKTVARQEKKLKMGSELLNAETSSYTLSGHEYTRRRVEIDLARTFEGYKNNMAILKSKRALIKRQNKAVVASQIKLDSVRASKADLDNTIATLKVQKKELDAMAAANRRFDLDDSALSEATEVLAGVKKRLDIAQKMIEDDIFFESGIPVEDNQPKRDIVKEIRVHFAEGAPTKKGLSVRNTLPIEVGR